MSNKNQMIEETLEALAEAGYDTDTMRSEYKHVGATGRERCTLSPRAWVAKMTMHAMRQLIADLSRVEEAVEEDAEEMDPITAIIAERVQSCTVGCAVCGALHTVAEMRTVCNNEVNGQYQLVCTSCKDSNKHLVRLG